MTRRAVIYIQRAFVAVLVIWRAVMLVLWTRPRASAHSVAAHIVRITATTGARSGPAAIVVAATDSGITGSRVAGFDNLKCHVGDDVDGRQIGVSLTIDLTTCRRSVR